MKKLLIFIGLFVVTFSCGPKEDENPPPPLEDNGFVAVPMPSLLVTGDPFPTDSTVINGWVANSTERNNLETNEDIINHGWGIWSALTEMTDQVNNNQPLRRFETWYTPEDVKDAYKRRKTNPGAELKHVQRNTGKLKIPHQLDDPVGNPNEAGVTGFVKYDPTAAEHIYDNNLFYQSTLEGMLRKNEIANVPNFPNSGVALKPVFFPLSTPEKEGPYKGLYKLSAWPGDDGNPNRTLEPGTGAGKFNNDVYITLTGETDKAQHIFSINDFIHFKMDSAQAKNTVDIFGVPFKAGDYSVLVAMHVTTREITRWTWQSFWWSETPDTPHSPSSASTAALRNDKNLDRQASHYAMTVAYNLVTPAQPYNGGSGTDATSLYAYNPYLEASFGPTDDPPTFAQANDTIRQHYPISYQEVGGTLNKWGMETNCMACHGQARYLHSISPPAVPDSLGLWQLYITDQYFALDAPYFKNSVKLDFTWSIRGNLIPEPATPTN